MKTIISALILFADHRDYRSKKDNVTIQNVKLSFRRFMKFLLRDFPRVIIFNSNNFYVQTNFIFSNDSVIIETFILQLLIKDWIAVDRREIKYGGCWMIIDTINSFRNLLSETWRCLRVPLRYDPDQLFLLLRDAGSTCAVSALLTYLKNLA